MKQLNPRWQWVMFAALLTALAACAPEPDIDVPTLMALPSLTPMTPTQTPLAISDAQIVVAETRFAAPTATFTETRTDIPQQPTETDTHTPPAPSSATDTPAGTTRAQSAIVMRGAPTFAALQNRRLASAGAIYYVVSRDPIPVYACPAETCELVWLLAPGGQVNVLYTIGVWHFIAVANQVSGFIAASAVTSIAPTRLPTRTPTPGIQPLNLNIETPLPYIIPPYYGGSVAENVLEDSVTPLPRTPWLRPPTQTYTPSRTPTVTRTPTNSRPGAGTPPPTSTRATPGAPSGGSPPPGSNFTRTPSGQPPGGSPPPTQIVTVTPSPTWTFTSETPIVPTETPTPSPTWTVTPTATWTMTPSPTWTLTPSPTWTFTPTLTPTTAAP